MVDVDDAAEGSQLLDKGTAEVDALVDGVGVIRVDDSTGTNRVDELASCTACVEESGVNAVEAVFDDNGSDR